MPKPFRKAWVWLGKFFADFAVNMRIFGAKLLLFIKSPFLYIGKAFTWVVGFIKGLPALLATAGTSIKAMGASLMAMNPIGWVVIVIGLLVLLYVKSEKFRVFVNNLFKMIFEFLKLVWNSLMYLITLIMVGCKKAWNWFKTYIWTPIADFFKRAGEWISDMWGKFMNTSVGKWINKCIVTPLKTLFKWIVDAWDWVVGGIAKAIEWLAGANNEVSQATKELAKNGGVPEMPTFEGDGTPADGTNYLNSQNWGTKDPTATEGLPKAENPMITTAPSGVGGGGGSVTNMNFDGGAIQIVVNKGESIDEQVLAKKIKDVLKEVNREGDMRGGT
jgi:hypothetical protein